MAYVLKSIFESFDQEIKELNQIVSVLASQPQSLARDTHIEGCFIRLVVGWECFIEEYFLRCMCRAQTRSKSEIKPKITPLKNTNEAFKKINKHRKDRDKDFTDWLDPTSLQQRVDDNFRKNSRVQKICGSPEIVFELRIIRNAITHRSPSAIAKFKKYVKNQMGYLSEMNPTMASLLIQKRRNSPNMIFSILSSHFLLLSHTLTK